MFLRDVFQSIPTSTLIHIHPNTHTPLYTYTLIHIHPYTHTPLYTYTLIHIHPYTHTHVYTYTLIHIHTDIRIPSALGKKGLICVGDLMKSYKPNTLSMSMWLYSATCSGVILLRGNKCWYLLIWPAFLALESALR